MNPRDEQFINEVLQLSNSKLSADSIRILMSQMTGEETNNLISTIIKASGNQINFALARQIKEKLEDYMNRMEEESEFDQLLESEDDQDFFKKISSMMNEKAKSGVNSDEIPGTSGKFGLEPTNPIPVNGIRALKVYISQLEYKKGRITKIYRVGSLHQSGIRYPIDQYRVEIDDQKALNLYFSAYHQKMSLKAPEGFRLMVN